MTSTINIPPRFLQEVHSILQQHIPDCDVWAYGSRVAGAAWEASDLDLVVRVSCPSVLM
jgi:predicted nucleotidyltransferase